MLINKGTRFRLYPTEPQRTTFARVCGSCRYVRNLALEQRRMFARKGRPIGYTAQANDLPELRQELDWLREVPNQCLQQALVDLNTAFQRFFNGEAGYPQFHKRFEHDSFRFPALTQRQVVKKDGEAVLDEHGEPVWHTYEVVGLGPDWIDPPKIGKVRMVRHQALEGEPKSVTVVRDGEDWYAAIVCTVEVPDPWDDGGRPATAYDVGAIRHFAMPDGTVFDVPGATPGEEVRKLRLERKIARCVEACQQRAKERGVKDLPRSSRELKLRAALRRLEARLRRRRDDALHKFTTWLAKNHGLIGIEDLNLKAMTASARGTVEQPGTNVAQKAGLNRSLLAACAGKARRMLAYKAVWYGSVLVPVPVPAPFTSQICSACRRHPLDDPQTAHLPHGRDGDRFRCPLCGFTCAADENAARNIERLALAIWTARLEAMAQKRPTKAKVLDKRRRSPFGRKAIQQLAGGRPVPARGALGAGQAGNREVDESLAL